MTIIQVSGINPDSASISKKEIINLSYSQVDVSQSNAIEKIKPSFRYDGHIVVIPELEENKVQGYLYYTHIYKEKLNYSTWVTRINRTFTELTNAEST